MRLQPAWFECVMQMRNTAKWRITTGNLSSFSVSCYNTDSIQSQHIIDTLQHFTAT